MSDAMLEALTEKRAKLQREADGIRPVVERTKAEYQEAEQALQRATERIAEVEVEIRQATSA